MQILEARDKRVELIEELLKYNKVIISLKTNYPGDNKDNIFTQKTIKIIDKEIKNRLTVENSYFLNCGEGYVYIYLVNSFNPYLIKEKAIEIENTHPLGRLVDIDVYYNSIKSISRKDLSYGLRKCFLCDNDAFICIRNKNHTYEEIISYIKRLVDNYEEY